MAKRGRPFSDNPRTEQYRLLMTKDERNKLEDVCKMTGMRISDVLRTGVKKLYEIEKAKESMED